MTNKRALDGDTSAPIISELRDGFGIIGGCKMVLPCWLLKAVGVSQQYNRFFRLGCIGCNGLSFAFFTGKVA